MNNDEGKKLSVKWIVEDSPISEQIIKLMTDPVKMKEFSKELDNNIREVMFKEELNDIGVES
jgi:hypothetical protein